MREWAAGGTMAGPGTAVEVIDAQAGGRKTNGMENS